jgi:hypothetical protein
MLQDMVQGMMLQCHWLPVSHYVPCMCPVEVGGKQMAQAPGVDIMIA